MEPLNDETRAWLDDAMREEALPPSDRARLWSEISASVAAPVGVKLGLLDRAMRVRHVIGVAMIVFAAGVVTGRVLIPSSAPVAQPAPTVTSSSTPPPVSASAVASTPPLLASTTPSAAPATTSSSAAAAPIRGNAQAGSSMDEVRAIIKAKRALEEKRPADALVALEEHERAFPHGSLAEERDALRVLALCAAGRATDGKTERATFLRSHPLSAYVDRVRAACVE